MVPTFAIIAGLSAIPLAYSWTGAFYVWGINWPRNNTAPPFMLLAWLYGTPAPGFEELVYLILLLISFPIACFIILTAWAFVFGGIVVAAAGLGAGLGCVVGNSYNIWEKIHYLFVPHPAALIVQRPRIDGKALADQLGADSGSRLALSTRARHAKELADALRKETEQLDRIANTRKEMFEAEADLAHAAEELEKARMRRDAIIKRGQNRA